jgi:hypothetical protein
LIRNALIDSSRTQSETLPITNAEYPKAVKRSVDASRGIARPQCVDRTASVWSTESDYEAVCECCRACTSVRCCRPIVFESFRHHGTRPCRATCARPFPGRDRFSVAYHTGGNRKRTVACLLPKNLRNAVKHLSAYGKAPRQDAARR